MHGGPIWCKSNNQCLLEEGMRWAREASEIFERLGHVVVQAMCSMDLTWALYDNERFDAVEETAFHRTDGLHQEGQSARAIIFPVVYNTPTARPASCSESILPGRSAFFDGAHVHIKDICTFV